MEWPLHGTIPARRCGHAQRQHGRKGQKIGSPMAPQKRPRSGLEPPVPRPTPAPQNHGTFSTVVPCGPSHLLLPAAAEPYVSCCVSASWLLFSKPGSPQSPAVRRVVLTPAQKRKKRFVLTPKESMWVRLIRRSTTPRLASQAILLRNQQVGS